jgi:small subunit ribosomal protein S20
MANKSSAIKAARQMLSVVPTTKRASAVCAPLSKKLRMRLLTGNRGAAEDAFKLAQPIIHGSVNDGLLHKNTAARKLSRLTARIRTLAA